MLRLSSWGLLSLALALTSCTQARDGLRPQPPDQGEARAPVARAAVVPASVQAPKAAEGGHTRRDIVRMSIRRSVRLSVQEDGVARRSASGVVVARELTSRGSSSYVLTNAHAIDGRGMNQPKLVVTVGNGPDAQEYVGEPVAFGQVPELDLALVRVRGVQLEPVELASDAELELGADVLVVGAPFGRALSLSGGMVSHVDWDPGTRRPSMLKTDAAIGYGTSGGGVYSLATGRLLAIVEGYRTAKVGFQVEEKGYSFDVPMPGETFAAPSAKIRQFLRDKGFGHLLEPQASPQDPRSASR